MPGKTQADRLLDLEKVVPTVVNQLETTAKAADALGRAHQETVGKVIDLRLDYETTIVLLKKEIEDLKQWKDDQKKDKEERVRRAWSFGPNVVGAVINVLLAAVVAYLLATRPSPLPTSPSAPASKSP